MQIVIHPLNLIPISSNLYATNPSGPHMSAPSYSDPQVDWDIVLCVIAIIFTRHTFIIIIPPYVDLIVAKHAAKSEST